MRSRTTIIRAVVGIAVLTAMSAGTTSARATAAPPTELERSIAGDALQKAFAHSPRYGGVRGSADGRGLDVYVTDLGNSADRSAARRAAGSVPVRFVHATHSWNSLIAASDRITRDIAALQKRGYGIRSLWPTVAGNALEVGVLHPSAVIESALRATYGSGVRVVSARGGAYFASRLNDSSPWNGGDFLAFDNGQDCTAGPAVKNAAGKTFLLTAGHCFFDESDTSTHPWTGSYGYRVFQGAHGLTGDAQPYIGNAAAERGNGYDSALVDTPASGLVWRTANANDQSTAVPQKSEFASTEATAGLCVSGAYSGERCAVDVDRLNGTVFYGPEGSTSYVSHLVEAHNRYGYDVAGESDSGAPVYAVGSTGLAMTGILLGGPAGNAVLPCTRNNIGPRTNKCTAVIWYANLSSVMNHRGVSLVIR